jgi:hypothetical protein
MIVPVGAEPASVVGVVLAAAEVVSVVGMVLAAAGGVVSVVDMVLSAAELLAVGGRVLVGGAATVCDPRAAVTDPRRLDKILPSAVVSVVVVEVAAAGKTGVVEVVKTPVGAAPLIPDVATESTGVI